MCVYNLYYETLLSYIGLIFPYIPGSIARLNVQCLYMCTSGHFVDDGLLEVNKKWSLIRQLLILILAFVILICFSKIVVLVVTPFVNFSPNCFCFDQIL